MLLTVNFLWKCIHCIHWPITSINSTVVPILHFWNFQFFSKVLHQCDNLGYQNYKKAIEAVWSSKKRRVFPKFWNCCFQLQYFTDLIKEGFFKKKSEWKCVRFLLCPHNNRKLNDFAHACTHCNIEVYFDQKAIVTIAKNLQKLCIAFWHKYMFSTWFEASVDIT